MAKRMNIGFAIFALTIANTEQGMSNVEVALPSFLVYILQPGN